MLSALLYAASIGIIGLVSYIYLTNLTKNHKDSKDKKDAAPELPKRPAALEKKREEHANTAGAKSANESKAPVAAAAASRPVSRPVTANSSPVITPSASPPARSSPSASPPARPSPSASPLVSPPPPPPAAASTPAESDRLLLSLALNSPPPVLPKRPMLNILHAPTLTKSFSPSPNHSAQSALESASPTAAAPSPATGGSAASDEKMAAHRKQVQWELVSSEEKYIHFLNILMSVYFNPLKAKADKGSAKLTTGDFALLFSNVESIWKFHHLFLAQLKTSQDGNVAAVLHAHADYLRMYTKYVSDYSPALATINKLSRNADFVRFLKKQRDSPASEGADIMSYLIMPVQRVPRYLLLLRELQKYTPSSHPHHASIVAAIEKIEKIATHINEQQRHHENASTLLELQHQIHNADDVQIFQPHRRLVRHGILTLVKQEGTANAALKADHIGGNFNVILFNDIVIYTTLDYDYRGLLKLHGCKLNVDNLLVELVKPKSPTHRVQMSLRLECPSLDEVEKWAKSLRESIANANELSEKDERRKSAASNSISLH